MRTFQMNSEVCYQDKSELDFVEILKDNQKKIVLKMLEVIDLFYEE